MRHVKSKLLPGRLTEWMDRLNRCNGEKMQAGALYCGSAWVPVTRLLASKRVRVWIISAGHGLITPETDVCSYTATFSSNHPDSVVPNGSDAFQTSEWWRALNRLGNRSRIRGLAGIAKAFPNTPLIAALSSEYLRAVESDLTEARECLREPDSMIVISSGAAKNGSLETNFLPCDARMENMVGRGRSALNVRLLAAIIADHGERLRASELIKRYNRMLKRLPEAAYPKREKSSDDDVREFIRRAIASGSPVSHSSLLRKYRDSGLACEQSRFRGLFHQLEAELEMEGE